MSDRREALKNLALMAEVKGHVERVVAERDELRFKVERLTAELAAAKERADSNFQSLERVKQKFEQCTARAKAAEAAAECCLVTLLPDAQLPVVAKDRAEYVNAVLAATAASVVRLMQSSRMEKEAFGGVWLEAGQ